MTFEASLQYELSPFPLSLFDNKDQKMNKANKADFLKTSLKALTDPIHLTIQEPCCTLQFSSTFTMDQILHWVKFGTTYSQGRQQQE